MMFARLNAAALLLSLSAFGMFGFFSSFEPGARLAWRIGYALFTLLIFASGVWLGLCAGGLTAFAVAFVLFEIGPRGDLFSVIVNLKYGLIALPFDTMFGALIGLWVSLRGVGQRVQPIAN